MAKKTYKPTHVLIHVTADKHNPGKFTIIPFSRNDLEGMWSINDVLTFEHYFNDIDESEINAENTFEAINQAASDNQLEYAVVLTVKEYLSGATKKKNFVNLPGGLTYTGSEILELTKDIRKI